MPTMQRKLQRVRTSMGTIGVPDAASNCYLHKGRPFNICMPRECYTNCLRLCIRIYTISHVQFSSASTIKLYNYI